MTMCESLLFVEATCTSQQNRLKPLFVPMQLCKTQLFFYKTFLILYQGVPTPPELLPRLCQSENRGSNLDGWGTIGLKPKQHKELPVVDRKSVV